MGDGEMDGEGDVTIGRDQCEQETSGALCRCAAGIGTACSFTDPPTKPPPIPTLCNNDELDLINSSVRFLEPRQGRGGAGWLTFVGKNEDISAIGFQIENPSKARR